MAPTPESDLTSDDYAIVEAQLAAASSIPDIEAAKAVTIGGAESEELPADGPQTLREMMGYIRDEIDAGRIWVGWHESGVFAWGDVDVDAAPEGTEVLALDHVDIDMLAGAVTMSMVNQSKEDEERKRRRAQQMIAASDAAAKPQLILPGGGGNRAERRAKHTRR